MSVSEQNALIRAKDVTGNSFLIYPITKAENVDGLDELIDKTQPADYVINATYDMATVDKAYDDIVAAYNAGSRLVLYHDSEKFNFVAGGPGEFVFEKINVDSSNGVTVARASIYGQDNYLYRAEYKKFDNSETVPITKGGTGATTAADALTNIGAAPAGLITANYEATSDTELDAMLDSVLEDMDVGSARYIRISCNPAGVAIDSRHWITLVFKNSASYATVTASRHSASSESGQIKTYERCKLAGVWQDWYEPKTNTSLVGVTTSGDGAAYTATVSGITSLTAGVSFTMIPHVVSTSTSPTLDVNGLGAKNIRRRLSSSTTSTVVGYAAAWLGANKPIKVEYDGTYWIADLPKPSASDLSGTLPIANGGTGATTTSAALANLGAAPAGLVAGSYSVTSDTELDAALETVLSGMGNNTARYIRLSCNPAGVAIDGGYWLTLVYKYSDSYATVTASRYSMDSEGGQIKICERSKVNGTWQAWYEPKNYAPQYGWRQKISSNEDLNDYVKIGNYAVAKNSVAASLSNCPTTTAFILNVFSANGSQLKTPPSGSTAYIYYTQEIINIAGDQWIRSCTYNAGTWSYGTWNQIATIRGHTGTTASDDKYIDMYNTVNGTTRRLSVGINSDQEGYIAVIGDSWINAIVVDPTYTKSMLPFVVPATQYGSTLPSSGTAGQLFFKI